MIETIDTHLPLNVGDNFYFAIRGTTPRSENEYRTKLKTEGWKDEFIDEMIEVINEESDKHHIHEFKVKSISRSYTRSHMLSISDPEITYYETITVEEAN